MYVLHAQLVVLLLSSSSSGSDTQLLDNQSLFRAFATKKKLLTVASRNSAFLAAQNDLLALRGEPFKKKKKKRHEIKYCYFLHGWLQLKIGCLFTFTIA